MLVSDLFNGFTVKDNYAELRESIGWRKNFYEAFLTELPAKFHSAEGLYKNIKEVIDDCQKYGIEPKKIGDGFWKIDAGDGLVRYWLGDSPSSVDVAVELEKRGQDLVVIGTGKNPKLKGSPFAAELYAKIAKDCDTNIRFVSDEKMTDTGLKIWKRLVSQGFKISLYDSKNPGSSFKTFTSPHELDVFFADEPDFKRYQFVMSESGLQHINLKSHFKRVKVMYEGVNALRFNRESDWRKAAAVRGLSIEEDGSGKLVATKDGKEFGFWDPKYGGCGFGWFNY